MSITEKHMMMHTMATRLMSAVNVTQRSLTTSPSLTAYNNRSWQTSHDHSVEWKHWKLHDTK